MQGIRSHFAVQTAKSVRKIRVICYDPDATDSSSDDEKDVRVRCRRKSLVSSGGFSGRTLIHEIVIPIPSSSTAALTLDFERSTDSCSRKRRFTKSNESIADKKKQRQMKRAFRFLAEDAESGKCNGGSWRRWTKWAANVRDSVRGVAFWLDSYSPVEDNARAYERKSTETDDGVSSPMLDRRSNRRTSVNTTSCLLGDDDDHCFSLSSPSSVLDLSTTSESIPSWDITTKAREAIGGNENGSRQGECPAATGTHLMDFKKELVNPSSLHDLAGFQHQENRGALTVELCTNCIDLPVLNALVDLTEEGDDNIGISQESLNVDVDAEVLSWLNF